MKITPSILSIPPYLSTSWKNILSLHALPEAGGLFKLVVILTNKLRIVIPSMDKDAIDSIFEAHANYSTAEEKPPKPQTPFKSDFFGGPLATADLLGSQMQHNPEQADAPELPKEILEKIASIAKVLGLEDTSQLPKPEANCNCPFCQIARTFQSHPDEAKIEEEVRDEDLTFRTWDVLQKTDHLYTVTDPLDRAVEYTVFLGEKVGCNCGQKNCEHIRAVLNT